jgi:Rrf2 family transcriptional regulator, iron-sulfur cluster assembly transcription factor
MRFELGHKGDYALRAMVHLGCHADEGLQKSQVIASSMDVPEKYLPQILGVLIRHGLVRSHAGPRGGYALTRAPESITLLEIVEAAEGPIGSAVCPLRARTCDGTDPCAVHDAWRTAQSTLIERLASVSLASVAGEAACERDCAPRAAAAAGALAG